MSLFSFAPSNAPKSNKFKQSYNRKLSFKAGELVPLLCKEILPGDKFKFNASSFVRQMPMVAPMMHEMNLNFCWFFVPNRLVWNEWEKFITGPTGSGEMAPQKPYISTIHSYSQTSHQAFKKAMTQVSGLPDYLGMPVTQFRVDETQGVPSFRIFPADKFDAMPFRAYQLIWNTYFRDQNLQNEIDFSKESGRVPEIEHNSLTQIRRVCWKKDYFTSALPFAQRGPEVSFSIGETANLVVDKSKATQVEKVSVGQAAALHARTNAIQESELYVDGLTAGPSDSIAVIDVTGNTTVDLSNATATSINELRRMARLQEWFETKARGGGRFFEQIFSFFGVLPKGSRLDLPEYLGGGMQPFIIDSVAQTSSVNEETTPLATLAGKGLSVGNIGIKTKQFDEHGLLFCLVFARPKPSYQQGLSKLFTRWSSIDYYWPTFARLGEQEVLNQEIYYSEDVERNAETFGYQSRYAEYKYTPDQVSGQLKTTLNYWHMGRIFGGNTEAYESANAPTLSAAFVECNPTKRIYAITDKDEDELILEVQFTETASRKMPYHITPKL